MMQAGDTKPASPKVNGLSESIPGPSISSQAPPPGGGTVPNEHSIQLLSQAEGLKASLAIDSFSDVSEARMKLQEYYTRLLLADLEFSLDQKVEQELWNIVFKQPVTDLQAKVRDRKNQNRAEAQVSLGNLLDAACDFYLRLLVQLRAQYVVPLPPSERWGVQLPNGCLPEASEKVGDGGFPWREVLTAIGSEKGCSGVKAVSCAYLCQHCLVHLGDVARYRLQKDQARAYYAWAAAAGPACGHPYNQLAILEAARNHYMACVYYYARSVACATPFPAAGTNLEKFFERLALDPIRDMPRTELPNPMETLTTAFLQYHAAVHLMKDLPRARTIWDRFLGCLPHHLEVFSWEELVYMAAIQSYALFTHLHRRQAARQHQPPSSTNTTGDPGWARQLLQSTLGLVGALAGGIQITDTPPSPGQEEERKTGRHGLPALLLLLLWYRLAAREGYFRHKGKDALVSGHSNGASRGQSTTQTAGYFPAVVVDCLNSLLSGQPSEDPGCCSAPVACSPSGSDLSARVQFKLNGDPCPSELDLTEIVQLPEIEMLQGYLPLSIPVIPWTSEDPHNAQNGEETTSQLWSRRRKAVLGAARYIAHHEPTLLQWTHVESGEGHSEWMFSRGCHGVAVVTSPTVQTVLNGEEIKGSNSWPQPQTTDVLEHHPMTGSSSGDHSSIQPSLSCPSQQSSVDSSASGKLHHPGIIINADIARFIQEQAAQEAAKALVPPGGVVKRQHTTSTSSHATTGSVASSGGHKGLGDKESSDKAAAARHLYNQNRDQFQKDLPPRFARRSVGGGSSQPQAAQPAGSQGGLAGSSSSASSSSTSLLQVGQWEGVASAEQAPTSLALTRKESEPLFPPPSQAMSQSNQEPHPPLSWLVSESGNVNHGHQRMGVDVLAPGGPVLSGLFPHGGFFHGEDSARSAAMGHQQQQQDLRGLQHAAQRFIGPGHFIEGGLSNWNANLGDTTPRFQQHGQVHQPPRNPRNNDARSWQQHPAGLAGRVNSGRPTVTNPTRTGAPSGEMPVIDHWLPSTTATGPSKHSSSAAPARRMDLGEADASELFLGNVQSLWSSPLEHLRQQQNAHQQSQMGLRHFNPAHHPHHHHQNPNAPQFLLQQQHQQHPALHHQQQQAQLSAFHFQQPQQFFRAPPTATIGQYLANRDDAT